MKNSELYYNYNLTNALLSLDIKLSSYKVLNFIMMNHNFQNKNLSISYISTGTGISKRSVTNSMYELRKLDLIIVKSNKIAGNVVKLNVERILSKETIKVPVVKELTDAERGLIGMRQLNIESEQEKEEQEEVKNQEEVVEIVENSTKMKSDDELIAIELTKMREKRIQDLKDRKNADEAYKFQHGIIDIDTSEDEESNYSNHYNEAEYLSGEA